jgi:uncharacterized protein YegP (UPF0339 family)
MATATTHQPVAQRGTRATEAAGFELLIFEDNGGDYRWAIVDAAGESLAQSGVFATYDEAQRGARRVQTWGGSDRAQRRSSTDRATGRGRSKPSAVDDAVETKRRRDERGRR